MQNDLLPFMFDCLKNGSVEYGIDSIHSVIDKLKHKHGISTDYSLTFKNLKGTDLDSYDIILNPGSIVPITIHDSFILECILEKRHNLKKRLEEAVERLPRMNRTLRHMIPLNVAIALKRESKQWYRIPAPLFEEKILHSKYIETEFTIRVTDNLTHTTISLTGDDPVQLKKQAIKRLSLTIFESEELVELVEDMEYQAKMNKEAKESQISIGGTDGELREKREY